MSSSSFSSVKYAPRIMRPQGIQPATDNEKANWRPSPVMSTATTAGPSPLPRSSSTTCRASATPRVSGSFTFIIIALMDGPQAEAEKPPMKTAMQASATAACSSRGSFTSHNMGGVLVITISPVNSGIHLRLLLYSHCPTIPPSTIPTPPPMPNIDTTRVAAGTEKCFCWAKKSLKKTRSMPQGKLPGMPCRMTQRLVLILISFLVFSQSIFSSYSKSSAAW
mmetsp:Transcript_13656/g.41254  ORF Transcript_13656/g.41254 Transcript_13656/m.41254 type:complete len:222 (-) Transcript_13656:1270-1935(-)